MEEKFYPENIFQKISKICNIEKFERTIILESLKILNPNLEKTLQEYLLLFDSYRFIKSDKNLMFISRDLWQTELNKFREMLEKEYLKIEFELNKLS